MFICYLSDISHCIFLCGSAFIGYLSDVSHCTFLCGSMFICYLSDVSHCTSLCCCAFISYISDTERPILKLFSHYFLVASQLPSTYVTGHGSFLSFCVLKALQFRYFPPYSYLLLPLPTCYTWMQVYLVTWIVYMPQVCMFCADARELWFACKRLQFAAQHVIYTCSNMVTDVSVAFTFRGKSLVLNFF